MEESERRAYVRLQVELPVSYSVEGRPTQHSLTQDVGAQGMRFLTDSRLDPKTSISLMIRAFDPEQSISINGRVAWSRPLPLGDHPEHLIPFETGIEFIEVHPDRQTLLMRSIRT